MTAVNFRTSCLSTFLAATLLGGCAKPEYSGGESFPDPKEVNAAHQGKTVLVHMKGGLKPDDAQPCVAFNVALGLVKSGYKVTILIDAGANTDFLGETPEKTNWGKYQLPPAVIDALAAELDMPREKIPTNYMGLLKYISDEGASIYMNGTMNILLGKAKRVREGKLVPDYIKLASVPEMAAVLCTRHHLQCFRAVKEKEPHCRRE